MCGIAGCLQRRESSGGDTLEETVATMGERLRHRGPDDHGTWVDASAGVGLAHRRLAVIDLSPTGRQPMESADGRFVMVYNGELYNHQELRDRLARQGVVFRGRADTEVLLEAVSAWGMHEALARSNGMYALAVWDRWRQTLALARDRVGEKPLYYGWRGPIFLFASELKALVCHPLFEPEINRDALALYMRYGYVPAPHSIFNGIGKLFPGTWIEVSPAHPGEIPEPSRYWSMLQALEDGVSNPFTGSAMELCGELDGLLHDSVALRMFADVPVGAFLSGGIDSSLIVAIMQANRRSPVKTYTIGFTERGYDEAVEARAVAEALGTEHTELYVTMQEATEVIPRLPSVYDEPFADPSQIPTMMVSQLARREVTVTLSGDGGDELFAGYSRYLFSEGLGGVVRRLPGRLQGWISALATAVPPEGWDRATRLVGPALPRSLRQVHLGQRVHRFADTLGTQDLHEAYRQLISHWQRPEELVLGSMEPPGIPWHDTGRTLQPCLVGRLQYRDSVSFLPDDILTKLDRASMAFGLEARVPFLDHRVVELSWRVPQEYKINRGVGKWLLRRLLERYLPATLFERPKSGFVPPTGHWLRGPLRDWAEEFLSRERLAREGLLNAELVTKVWDEHKAGARNWEQQLWDVLMFETWLATLQEDRAHGRNHACQL